MEWKKDQFLITVLRETKVREHTNGITTLVGNFPIGIHKADAGVWVVTDLETGYMMNIQSTQKAAKQWVEDNADIIIEMLSKPAHQDIVEEIKQCRIKSE